MYNALSSKQSTLSLLFFVRFEVLIYYGDSQENPGPGTNGTHEVSNNRQSSNAHAAKCCCNGNVAVQLFLQRLNSVAMPLQ